MEREREPYRGVALPLEDSVYPVKEMVQEKIVVGAGVGNSSVGWSLFSLLTFKMCATFNNYNKMGQNVLHVCIYTPNMTDM